MATTTTQPVRLEAATSRNPLVIWHLLSLDAPSVASLWTWVVAHANGVHLPWTTPAAMFLAVWVLYAADRLLDARKHVQTDLRTHTRTSASPSSAVRITSPLEARHFFHHRHRTRFLAIVFAAGLLLATLLPRLNPVAFRLFLAEASALTLWFFTLHATRFARHLPKELALGPFFAAAIFIPTLARAPGAPLRILPGAVLFALLCTLNCLFIHRWEPTPYDTSAHPSTQLAARYTTPLALALLATAAVAAAALHTREALIPLACALSSAALLVLDRLRPALARTTMRALADAALLTPCLVLFFPR